MVAIDCQFGGCSAKIEHDSEAVALAMFQSHMMTHQAPVSSNAVPGQRLPPIQRPEVRQDITEEDWDAFIIEWQNFKRCTNLPSASVTDQLYQCCERSLARLLIKEQPNIVSTDEGSLLSAMNRLAVIKVATSVRRSKLLSTRQSHGEGFREFYANVKAAAATCNFQVRCPNDCCKDAPPVDYTSSVIKDVIVLGIADSDIQKDVLAWEELDDKDDKAVVAFVETKELAQNAWMSSQSSGTAAGLSYDRRGASSDEAPIKEKLAMKGKCSVCREKFSIYKRYQSGRMNRKPFKLCPKCHKASQDVAENHQSEESAVTGFFIDTVEMSDPKSGDTQNIPEKLSIPTAKEMTEIAVVGSEVDAVVLDHHIFADDGWRKVSALSHPTVSLEISANPDDYRDFGYPCPKLTSKKITVVTDSGAQSCLWSRRAYLDCGFSVKDLIPVKHRMKAANRVPIEIDGAILLRLTGVSRDGETLESAVMVYVSPDANCFYLSKEAMIQLRIIDRDFPQIGAVAPSKSSIASNEDTNSVYAECGCLKRELPPEKPNRLPFDWSQTNSAVSMKDWLLTRYASSTFNKCPHQLLPTMDGPPIEIHVDEDAKPVAFLKPRPVALHWQKPVEEDLLRDETLGVIERPPHGEPTSWCFPMLITRKDDGSPRRIVDLSPLNKHCKREVHTSKSPFNLARSVPPNSVKTVVDAWNGYHSIPVKEADRRFLTFSTNLGLFRYKRAPQGFLSSGDGYNRRLDDLTSHIKRMERCVDDSLLHDKDHEVENHWWRVIDYLELCGKSGIVLNPEKFQFSESTVDFAGFRIAADTVEPLPKYLDSIRGFPTPRNISDIRSWFGLVHQVAHYAKLRDMLEPFRKFLSPKVRFEWSAELDKIFEESKSRIVEAIKDGVQIYDVTKRTCLRTDWSQNGVGYFLSQKHCDCESQDYGCCPDGWRITLAGSRFLTPAERNYAPVEGEALAVAWALEQTKFFTMGCDDLLVVVDHKPLVKILGDRRLDEIENPRLFRLKWKTLMWRYEIQYQRGTKNPFADAMSRHPNAYAELSSIGLSSGSEAEEVSFLGSISSDVERVIAVTWDRVKSESTKDATICALKKLTLEGFPLGKDSLDEETRSFWDARQHLSVAEDVLLYKDRVVIPRSLRPQVISNLHSAHQGVSSMLSRATSTMYWPGMTSDVQSARSTCKPCNRNAPSQPKLPPTAPELPTTPFEMIVADFFDLVKKHYLIIADRLSGWTEVVHVKVGSASSGSKGLCEALRKVFVTFGVPSDIGTDGGPEFTSAETEDFLSRWGVHHRLSSAYFPQSNGRAEVAVRVMKRLLEENVDANGNLDNDRVARALLQQRNTPDKDCGLSPAQVLFGRPLNDTLPRLDKSVMIFENNKVCSQWHEAWSAKEEAIRARLIRTCENLEPNSHELTQLEMGDSVMIQNQKKSSGRPNKWDRQGVVVASKKNDQYLVKVGGTGRLTLRNRRFLRKFEQPASMAQTSDEYKLTPQKPNRQPRSVHFAGPDSCEPTQECNRCPEGDTAAVPAPAVDQRLGEFSEVDARSEVAPEAPAHALRREEDTSGSPYMEIPRRSTRARKQTQVYDATTGRHMDPMS